MKKLIPLLVIAAGAVAYSVYKATKETVKEEEEKTLVVIDDTPSEDVHPEEPENPMKDVEEAAQEVQEELGKFETLSDTEEPYERPSFFHLTDDSYLEPEDSPKEEESVAVESEQSAETDELEDAVEVEPSFVVQETEEKAEVPVAEERAAEAVEEHAQETETSSEEMVHVDDENIFVPFFDVEPEKESTDETQEPFVIEDAINEIVQKVEEAVEEQPAVEQIPEETLEKEEVEEELEPLSSYDTPEVDELIKAIAGQVKAADTSEPAEETEIEEEQVSEPEPVEQSDEVTDYLQDIRKITEMYSEKVAQYNIRYPYLSSRFIDDTLKFSAQFNAEYPQGTRVAIEHHVHFDAVEDLFVFAQIIRQSGYYVREGSEDRTLVVIKEMYVDTNSILHDVFKVANQVYCLSGEYQKFRITKQ